MKQIIISITGSLLILKIVKIILPEGTVKKYASFIVSVLVMLILIASAAGSSMNLIPVFDDGYAEQGNTDKITEVQNSQIVKEFTRQLDEDMKKSIPQLKNAELLFEFEIDEDNKGYVSSMIIKSPYDQNDSVINRVSELYMIDKKLIEWRKK